MKILKYFILSIVLLDILASVFIMMKPHRIKRVKSWIDLLSSYDVRKSSFKQAKNIENIRTGLKVGLVI